MGMVDLKYLEKPSLFLLGFVLINSYIPGFIGASVPTGWLFLILVSCIAMLFVETRITNNHITGTLFVAYCLISFLWTQNFNIAFFFVMQTLALACVFCLGSALKDIKTIIIGLALGLIVSDIFGFIQYFKYNLIIFGKAINIFTLPDMTAGLFVNQNIFCEISVILFLSLLVYKLYWFLPITLPGIVLVHSRGAIVALIIGGIIWTYKQNKKAAFGLSGLIMTIGILYYFFRYDPQSTFERFDLWVDTIKGLTIFGNGIGSFEILYPLNAIHIDTAVARPRFAHNDLLQMIFEFGIGSILFCIMALNVLRIKCDDKILLYGIAIISMFSYPLHVPVISFMAFLVAGYITHNDDTFRFAWNSWRPILFKRC